MHLSPPSYYSNKDSRNCFLSSSPDSTIRPIASTETWLLPMLPRGTKTSLDTLKGCDKCLGYQYKVKFNQPSCWFYSVPNLLVFQQLVTLYLGEFLVRVVSEIVWKNAKECARKIGTCDWISWVTRSGKPPEVVHVPSMPEVEASC